MALTKEEKAKIIKEFGKNENDTGSTAVQIAILTQEINTLTDHFKDLENDALDLMKKLQPLASAYTQSTGKVGRPELPLDQQSEKTIQNEQSLDNNGGSNG